MPDSYKDGIGVWRCLTCLMPQPCGCPHSSKGLNDMAFANNPKKKPNGGVPRGRKSASKKPARKQSRKAVEKVLSGRLKQPRARPLPGMENVRISPLDEICTSIAEMREQQNALRQEEAGLETTALQLMRKHERASWRHAGVELIRVPGEEKLRVRTARERTATAESEEAGTDGENTAEAGDAEGAVDDAGDAADTAEAYR